MAEKTVIVVGGGLAGMSAAHTALENGARVVVIDKMAFCGGNSTKATSGINGTPTPAQKAASINDNVQIFTNDITVSAGHLARPDLIDLLAGQSGPAIEWIVSSFGVDLSIVGRLGGHSQPRTHRGTQKFPGFSITYAMIEKFEKVAKEQPHKAKLITKARVTRLLKEGDNCVGVEFEKDGKLSTVRGAVILASGGYGADHTNTSLLQKYRPDLGKMPTTNGEHCTGDGVKMAIDLGAALYDMDMVQVHPTGLVFPNEPDAKVLFLAAEALRGEGGVLLDGNGKRFCDELGRRDYVSGEMFKGKGPFRLVLNQKAADKIWWHCKHYIGRGVMKEFADGAAVAREIGVSESVLAKTFEDYNTIRPDPFGKKFFHNMPLVMKEKYYVAIVTPVVHYTMGGVAVDANAQLLSEATKKPIGNLFAAGEVVGGVHGKNRLGGNSLLDCVVYGRQAGKKAVERFCCVGGGDAGGAMGVSGAAGRRLLTIISHVSPQTTVTINVDGAGSGVTVSGGDAGDVFGAPTGAAASSGPPVEGGFYSGANVNAPSGGATGGAVVEGTQVPGKRTFTMDEVAKHNTASDCWVVVNGQVLDVTKFLKDHPGGDKAILVFAGRDATEEFNMLHAEGVVEKYLDPAQILGTVKV